MTHRSAAAWNARLAPYARPDARRAAAQLAATLALFAAAFAAARALFEISWPLAAPLLPVTGLALVRLFVLQHDCGHRSFLPGARACDLVGRALSVFTFTPYGFWRRDHDKHHAASGDLSRRGFGDIRTLTVAEYRALPARARLAYRLYRHPIVLFGLGPAWLFLVRYRLPLGCRGRSAGRARASILLTNLAIAAAFALAGWFVGYAALAAIFLPSVVAAGTLGVWLFFVQHQFEDAYWRGPGEWSYVEAALRGCSFYRLPAWLHWATGWIGYHHVHHLSARIPNYRLAQAYREIPELREAPEIGLAESLRCARLALWCERRQRLVSFRDAAA